MGVDKSFGMEPHGATLLYTKTPSWNGVRRIMAQLKIDLLALVLAAFAAASIWYSVLYYIGD